MNNKPLGRTGLMVTELCLGTMTWGSQNTEAEGHAQIDRAADAGINFMDTAELYAVPGSPETSGRTEEIIGNWFAKTGRRDDFILASKIGGGGNAFLRDGRRPDRQSIRQAVEASLKRLKTDRIDLYQVHWAPRGSYSFQNSWTYAPHTQDRDDVMANMLDILEGMQDMIDEGKIVHFGLSNETTWGIAQYLRLSEDRGLPRVASVQNEYSLIRRHFDLDLAELSHHEDVGLLAYSPLAAGLLTGKYAGGKIPAGSRAEYQKGMWRLNEHSLAVVDEYVALARQHGLDPAQMALAFCLTRPFMTSVIIGATSLEQLETCLAAVNVKLSEKVLAGIEAIHRRHPRPI
ncbi:NADP-dependent oxidoreductase [Devosia pacifica]|uniref:NADP-dependent oxidoreductase n=1 Tax=Devosia pacifica TaxID=1335967 RepID=A0A918S779_9HYPH|nr:aldo/keto reductase [Devosia pacifica]GHA27163.1 NADP-dependent oxidoreductase [Devosia pacifica]